jgi:hypothetical protein
MLHRAWCFLSVAWRHVAWRHIAWRHVARCHVASVGRIAALGKLESRGRNSYSDRHFMRASRLLEKSHLLPYALANMQVRSGPARSDR